MRRAAVGTASSTASSTVRRVGRRARGARGGALEFDGARNRIECDPSWEIHRRDELTVSGWFKIRGTDPGTQTLVGKGKAWWLRRDGARNTIEFGVKGPQTSGSSRGGSTSVVASIWAKDDHWHLR